MKVVVSYISSKLSVEETIKKIDNSICDGIHADLMDGLYVKNKNTLPDLSNISKPLDVHLMVNNPENYFDTLIKLKPVCIYIHPSTTNNPIKLFNYLTFNNIDSGIAINPNEEISSFAEYYPHIKRVLLMSVYPGCGGQSFIPSTKERLKELIKYKEKYNFEIYIDGGINDTTIKEVTLADGVVSGSFICNSDDYNEQIKKLK